MGINSVSGVRAPDRTGEALDVILKGLAIAEKGYGLYTASEEKDALAKQRDEAADRAERQLKMSEAEATRKADEEKRKLGGTATPGEVFDLQNKGFKVETAPQATGPLQSGQFRLKLSTGDGDVIVTPFIKPPTTATPVRVDTVKNGKNVTEFLDPKEVIGQTFEKPAPAPRQPTPKTVLRNELDENGNIVQVARDVVADQVLPEEVMSSKEVRKDVQNLVKNTDPHRQVLTSLDSVEKDLGFELEDYDFATQSVDGKPVDVPGVTVPFFGRVSGTSDRARSLNAKVAKIFNTELKTRSGAAVTDQELERLKEEFGQGKFDSEALLLGALKEYKALALQAMQSHEAAYDPLVLKEYGTREKAITSEFFQNRKTTAPSNTTAPTAEDAAAELARRRAARAQNGGG